MYKKIEQKWITGFWRRIGALLIDTLILGGVGLVLGLFFESAFVQMGGWGRLVGFSIALTYFGIMNSSICKGQTIGKKFLKIRVVDSNNIPINLKKSAIRYFIFAIPFSFNGANLSNEAILSFIIYPISTIIFGGIFSILYLYIFNRVTRQSLHDLIVDTYVVNVNVEKQEVGKVWNVHKIIVVAILLAAALVPVFTLTLIQNKSFEDMLAAQSALTNNPEVAYSTVTTGLTVKGSNAPSYVRSNVLLKTNKVNNPELASQLAMIIIKNYPESLVKDTLQINLTYGYDIGIASRGYKQSFNFNPIELKSAE